jgi:hypothetical protein
VIIFTRSPCPNASQLSLAARLNTSRARPNSLLVHQFTLSRPLSPSEPSSQIPRRAYAAASLQLAPRTAIDAARSPLKSP